MAFSFYLQQCKILYTYSSRNGSIHKEASDKDLKIISASANVGLKDADKKQGNKVFWIWFDITNAFDEISYLFLYSDNKKKFLRDKLAEIKVGF